MEMKQVKNGDRLTLYLCGRLDTNTAIKADNELKDPVSGVKEIVIDMAELEYISSSGLRLLMKMNQAMKGNVTILNAHGPVMDVFNVTGLLSEFNIE